MDNNENVIKRPKLSMSVKEMGTSLGLKKVESYELIKKNYFETRKVAGKYRVIIASFEEWYAGQFRYRKVNGLQPGTKYGELFFAEDICSMFGIARNSAKDLLHNHFPTDLITIDSICAVKRDVFELWYNQQSHYKKKNGELPEVLKNSRLMSAREMSDLLGIRLRNAAYGLISHGYFKSFTINGSLYVDIDSFEDWYKTQRHYKKVKESEDS